MCSTPSFFPSFSIIPNQANTLRHSWARRICWKAKLIPDRTQRNRPRFGCLVEKEEQERIDNIGLQTSHWNSFGRLAYCGDIPNLQVCSKTPYKNWSLIFYRSSFCKGQWVPVFKQFTFCQLCTSGHNITEKKMSLISLLGFTCMQRL